MQKIHILRAAMVAAFPEYERDPQNLRIWVEKGRVRSPGQSLNFEDKQHWRMALLDYIHDPALAHAVLVRWLKEYQPDILEHPIEGHFDYDFIILDGEKADIIFYLELEETVRVSENADTGALDIEYVPYPQPILPDDEPLYDPAMPVSKVDAVDD